MIMWRCIQNHVEGPPFSFTAVDQISTVSPACLAPMRGIELMTTCLPSGPWCDISGRAEEGAMGYEGDYSRPERYAAFERTHQAQV